MKRTPLKRKTPLKSNGCKLKRTPFKVKPKPKLVAAVKCIDLVQQLDKVFSQFIRLRDAGKDGYTKCISCGSYFKPELIQAGHYFSRRHMATRWDEDNVHAQCVFCNCHQHGNLKEYKPNLIEKIGQANFARLEIASKTIKHWSAEELKILIKYYTAKVKWLS